MAAKAINGAIITRIRKPSCSIDNTRPGWPSSSFVPVFNSNGGPSAAAALDAIGDRPTGARSASSQPGEVAELIGQEALPLGDGLQRRPSQGRSLAKDDVLDLAPAPAPEPTPKPASEPCSELGNPPGGAAVSVEVLAIPNRGGRRRKVERYPFATIKASRIVDGVLEGESFFIPEEEQPKRHIAVARKRYGPGRKFETRIVPGGVRVWRKS